MVRTVIQLTERQAQKLRKTSRDKGISMSELVRRGVELILTEQDSNEEARKRAKKAIGFVNSGTGDISVRHDEYFIEASLQ
jgi:hypothetical protein